MNTRDIATEYRLGHWAQIMQDRKESGLNITAYCKTKKIHPNTYFYWQKKLREAACNELLHIPVNQPNRIPSAMPTGWAVCEPKTPVPDEKAVYIEIGGNHVVVTSDAAPELIAKACRILMKLC